MIPRDQHDVPRTEREARAQRLGFALQALAADLVDERQKGVALRRTVAELRSRLESQPASHRDYQPEPTELLAAGRPWARWNRGLDRRYTLGVEEELMLLRPGGRSLAQSSDRVLARLSKELSLHASPETHAAVIELSTGIHTNVDGIVQELASLRRRLAHELAAMGLSVAAAGTHPLAVGGETAISSAPRYSLLADSLRSLARREPTMALHVHVGVPDPEDAVRLLNALRHSVPVLLALSANSPFWQGRDSGLDSTRTMIFQAFPRTGLPRSFAGYADYVDALDAVIGAGAVTEPSFFWWDVRLQPRFGTVEVRVMDAQSTIPDVSAIVALIQSLARLALEPDSPEPAAGAEVLAENRFLAARDGMDARLIEPATGHLVPVREMLDTMVARCRPHALALGCASGLERVRLLAAANGAHRQRALVAGNGDLGQLAASLAGRFLSPEWPSSADGTPPQTHTTTQPKGAADVPLARILRISDPPQRSALHTSPLADRPEPALAARCRNNER